jgi:hypothetical protein
MWLNTRFHVVFAVNENFQPISLRFHLDAFLTVIYTFNLIKTLPRRQKQSNHGGKLQIYMREAGKSSFDVLLDGLFWRRAL